MPQLHVQGVELVVALLDALEHLETLPPDYVKKLPRDTSVVLGELLVRDIAASHKDVMAS